MWTTRTTTERPPAPSSVSYLASCVDKEADPRAKGDCAAALGWVAYNFAGLRDKAVASMKSLQQSSQDRRVQSRLKSALWKLERALKAKRRPGRRSRDEVCR